MGGKRRGNPNGFLPKFRLNSMILKNRVYRLCAGWFTLLYNTVADPRGHSWHTFPMAQNVFNFTQFFGKFWQNCMLATHEGLGPLIQEIQCNTLMHFKDYTKIYLFKSTAKTSESCKHISSCFHGDKLNMIFFIDPNKEVPILVVPHTTCIRPVTCYPSSQ